MSQLSWDFEQDGSQLPLSQDEFEVLPTHVEVATAQAVGSAIEAVGSAFEPMVEVMQRLEQDGQITCVRTDNMESRMMRDHYAIHEAVRFVLKLLHEYKDDVSDLSFFMRILLRELCDFEVAELKRIETLLVLGRVESQNVDKIVLLKFEMIIVEAVHQSLTELEYATRTSTPLDADSKRLQKHLEYLHLVLSEVLLRPDWVENRTTASHALLKFALMVCSEI